MAKKKIIRIEASDIKTFRHLSNINRIINEQYNGQMPIEIYRGFLKRISNPAIKDIFIQKFRFKTPEKNLINLIRHNNHEHMQIQKYRQKNARG